MVKSSLRRYWNLIRNVRNWPAYFAQKRFSSFVASHYTTRGQSLTFNVPTKDLHVVFKEIFLTDFYSIDRWVNLLPGSPVVVDIGANAGYFNMLLLSRRPDARVFAYEPIEHNFKLFHDNIGRNPGIRNNIKLFHRAVTGNPTDHVVLFKEAGGENSVTASVFQDFAQHNLNSVTVSAISLTQILEENKLEGIDFLKLDCEGSEYPIMYDSPKAIWEKIRFIFLEVHQMDKGRRNIESMKQFLEGEGYSTSSELADNGCYALFAIKK